MIPLVQQPMPSLLVPPPCVRALPRPASMCVRPVLRVRVSADALGTDATAEALGQVCVSAEQALADMQATQMLFVCWCVLALQFIVFTFDKWDKDA